jgi:hypothetical protein
MDIKGFLLPNDTATDVRASDKTRLLQELNRRAARRPQLADGEHFCRDSQRRGVGIDRQGGGVAIPHALHRYDVALSRHLNALTG